MDYQPSLAPEGTSILLQQQVFDFVLAYSMALRDPAVKPYVTRDVPKRTVMMAMLFVSGESPLADTTEVQLLILVEAVGVTKQRWHATPQQHPLPSSRLRRNTYRSKMTKPVRSDVPSKLLVSRGRRLW
jgi:hypothetical protein